MTTPNSHADTARGAWIRRPGVLATLAALLVTLAAFVLGAVTDLSLGDGNYHLRKAEHFADAGRRLTHGPVYGPVVPPGIPYYDGPAWHAGLAILWRLTGKSVLVAHRAACNRGRRPFWRQTRGAQRFSTSGDDQASAATATRPYRLRLH